MSPLRSGPLIAALVIGVRASIVHRATGLDLGHQVDVDRVSFSIERGKRREAHVAGAIDPRLARRLLGTASDVPTSSVQGAA